LSVPSEEETDVSAAVVSGTVVSAADVSVMAVSWVSSLFVLMTIVVIAEVVSLTSAFTSLAPHPAIAISTDAAATQQRLLLSSLLIP
jgi:hypothetical protein